MVDSWAVLTHAMGRNSRLKIRHAAERMGSVVAIEGAGEVVLEGGLLPTRCTPARWSKPTPGARL